jgi:uncharacterized RDD family membrane protein YckC
MNDEAQNPYAPPVAVVLPVARQGFDLGEFDAAGNGKRFLNFIIDRVVLFGLMFVVGFGVALLHEMGVTGPAEWMNATTPLEDLLFGVALTCFYYVVMEGGFGLTVGKLITGTRVVDESGRKPSILAVLGRTLVRFVPFEPFSFFGGNPGGWHDGWSGTQVIDIRNRHQRLSPGLRKIYNRY